MHDVIVVGGGVIGLSIAHAIATGGRSVLVLDPGKAKVDCINCLVPALPETFLISPFLL